LERRRCIMEGFVDVMFQPLEDFWRGFISFVPNLLVMIFIFILGFLFAWVIGILLKRVLAVVKFDIWCDRVGLTALIRKGMYGQSRQKSSSVSFTGFW